MGADGDGVVPRDAGAGERQRHGRDGRQDAQVRGPEPLPEQAHDAEEAGISGGEHDYRTTLRFYPRERRREVSFKEDGPLGLDGEVLQVAPAAGHERGIFEQSGGFRGRAGSRRGRSR